MTVYVITKGDYSDYHICAVALDKDKAERLAKIFSSRWDDAQVEEYDTEIWNEALQGKDLYEVYFGKDGAVVRVEIEPDVSFADLGMVGHTWRYHADIIARVFARDAEAAIKIAAEKRAKYLAEQAGL